jgi:hypothetical protein
MFVLNPALFKHVCCTLKNIVYIYIYTHTLMRHIAFKRTLCDWWAHFHGQGSRKNVLGRSQRARIHTHTHFFIHYNAHFFQSRKHRWLLMVERTCFTDWRLALNDGSRTGLKWTPSHRINRSNRFGDVGSSFFGTAEGGCALPTLRLWWIWSVGSEAVHHDVSDSETHLLLCRWSKTKVWAAHLPLKREENVEWFL